jgi:hypothetical protein
MMTHPLATGDIHDKFSGISTVHMATLQKRKLPEKRLEGNASQWLSACDKALIYSR